MGCAEFPKLSEWKGPIYTHGFAVESVVSSPPASQHLLTTTMMQILMLFALAGAALANAINGEEVVTLTYSDALVDGGATMDVHINPVEETIRFHMEEQGNLGDVDTIEDYSVGFAASRVQEEEACFIRKLSGTLEEASAEAHRLASAGPQTNQGSEEVLAIPADDAEEWAGSRIIEHCGDFPIYKLVKTEEDVEAENALMASSSSSDNALETRQTSVSFRRCFFFFFIFKCITTTITVPTGTTIVFFFFG
ncbi:uncharacterized protein [Penaeus vannamei]|uniref:uncharacterized protein n=1 Tax=Penaeus vannamei TaxID=6689 RepID=UPI00387F4922